MTSGAEARQVPSGLAAMADVGSVNVVVEDPAREEADYGPLGCYG